MKILKIIMIGTTILILFIVIPNSISAEEIDKGNWILHRYDENHTGLQPTVGNGDISKYNIKWYESFGTGEGIENLIYTEPAVCDIDVDGYKEIIFGSDNNNLYCLNFEGKLKWKYSTAGRITCTPTIIDIDGDSELEIIITDGSGLIHVLSNSGSLIWSYETGECIDASAAIGDIDGNGELDIIVGNYIGDLFVISNTGDLIWKYNTGDGISVTALIYDLNKDNTNEIIVGDMGTGILYAITTEKTVEFENIPRLKRVKYVPKVLWQFETQVVNNLGILSSAVLSDLSNNGKNNIIFGASDGKLYCLDLTGKLNWEFDVGTPIYGAVAVGDINHDNNIEIIFTSENMLYTIDSKGILIWKVQLNLKRNHSPVLFDIDGNGYLEITATSKYMVMDTSQGTKWINAIDLLNYKGEIIHTLKFHEENTDYYHGVSVVDIENDGKLEILTGTDHGYLYCWGEVDYKIEVPPKKDDPIDSNNDSDNKQTIPSLDLPLLLISLILVSSLIKITKKNWSKH